MPDEFKHGKPEDSGKKQKKRKREKEAEERTRGVILDKPQHYHQRASVHCPANVGEEDEGNDE